MFEKFFGKGFVPEIWKLANIKPILKSGDSSLPHNYRPISVTCVLSKTMESIIRDQMLEYLHRNKLISKQQHGFLSRRSTCTQLLESLEDWSMQLRSGKSVDVVYVDFEKAFDSVVHSKLLAKLESYGVQYELHKWISEFLCDRRQRVFVGSGMSETYPVRSGVIQGSVLGTLLFLLFVNDVCDIFSHPVRTKLFADDVKLYSTVDTQADAEQLSKALIDLENWARIWQLKINEKKSAVMHFGNKNPLMGHWRHPPTKSG